MPSSTGGTTDSSGTSGGSGTSMAPPVVSRASVYQGIQFGVETTPGTVVAATVRMNNIEIQPEYDIPIKLVKYPGSKVATGRQLSQQSGTHKITSHMDFNVMPYIANGMCGAATITNLGTKTKQWVWTPSPINPLTPITYTVEQGSIKGAEQWGFGLFTGMNIGWGKDLASMDATMVSQQINRDFTMTTGLPRLPSAAADPTSVSTWISLDGTTWTKLTTSLEGTFTMDGLWAPTFHTNDTNASFDAVHELMPNFGGTITVEEGTEADTLFSHIEDGQLIALGVKVVGPLIETGTPNLYHMIRLYMPCYITKPAPGDKQGVWGNTYTFECGDMDTFGMFNLTVVNRQGTIGAVATGTSAGFFPAGGANPGS